MSAPAEPKLRASAISQRLEALLEQCVKLPSATLESFLLLAGVYQAGGDEAALYATAQSAIRRFPEEKRFYLAAATYAGAAQAVCGRNPHHGARAEAMA